MSRPRVGFVFETLRNRRAMVTGEISCRAWRTLGVRSDVAEVAEVAEVVGVVGVVEVVKVVAEPE